MSDPDYKEIAIKLWKMIDDIDTYSDQAKENDKAYRKAVEKKVRDRFDLIQSDGYSLFVGDVVVEDHPGSHYESDENHQQKCIDNNNGC